VRRQHEDANPAAATHGVLGCASGVARGGPENIELRACLAKHMLEEAPEELHGDIFKRKRRAV